MRNVNTYNCKQWISEVHGRAIYVFWWCQYKIKQYKKSGYL